MSSRPSGMASSYRSSCVQCAVGLVDSAWQYSRALLLDVQLVDDVNDALDMPGVLLGPLLFCIRVYRACQCDDAVLGRHVDVARFGRGVRNEFSLDFGRNVRILPRPSAPGIGGDHGAGKYRTRCGNQK